MLKAQYALLVALSMRVICAICTACSEQVLEGLAHGQNYHAATEEIGSPSHSKSFAYSFLVFLSGIDCFAVLCISSFVCVCSKSRLGCHLLMKSKSTCQTTAMYLQSQPVMELRFCTYTHAITVQLILRMEGFVSYPWDALCAS